ncbi:hypothetical protein CS542_02625 [Pedobacter sp. IW39]|nr:hypothetical protein CS542_02625 [Pedobacter sp. IW39]
MNLLDACPFHQGNKDFARNDCIGTIRVQVKIWIRSFGVTVQLIVYRISFTRKVKASLFSFAIYTIY